MLLGPHSAVLSLSSPFHLQCEGSRSQVDLGIWSSLERDLARGGETERAYARTTFGLFRDRCQDVFLLQPGEIQKPCSYCGGAQMDGHDA